MDIQTVKYIERFLEFFIIGLLFGIAEDVIAILVATDASFSWHMVWIVALIALPFAIISEIIVDGFKVFRFVRKLIGDEIEIIEEETGLKKKKMIAK